MFISCAIPTAYVFKDVRSRCGEHTRFFSFASIIKRQATMNGSSERLVRTRARAFYSNSFRRYIKYIEKIFLLLLLFSFLCLMCLNLERRSKMKRNFFFQFAFAVFFSYSIIFNDPTLILLLAMRNRWAYPAFFFFFSICI